MSFAKAKLPRNETKDNPKQIGNGFSNHKSYIPKIRSVSQPSTARSSQDNLRSRSCSDQVKIGLTRKIECLPSASVSPRDRSKSQSVKSDEFRDALSTKLSESAVELSDASLIGINDTSTLSKKSSASGIPLPVKLNSNPSKSSFRSKMPLRVNSGFGGRLSASTSPERRGFDSANKRSMELQFINKKKRFDAMKREFLDRQKPVLETYQALVQLKKKLEENGKIVILESIKVLDCEKCESVSPQKDLSKEQALDTSGGGERLERKAEFRIEEYGELHQVLKNIPASLLTVCKQIADRRKHILNTYEKTINCDDINDSVKVEINELKKETTDLDNEIEKIFGEQDETVNHTIENWHKLYTDAKNSSDSDNSTIKHLETKIKNFEQSIKVYEGQLKTDEKSICDSCKDYNKLEEDNKQMREHLKAVEKKIEHDKLERRKLQDEHNKFKDTDQSLKSTRIKYKELEADKQKIECKVVHLSSELQKAKTQLKQYEQKHDKYRIDIEKQIKLDAGVVEKLNKSKNVMETRLEFLQDQMDQQKRDFEKRETALLQELEEVRTESQLQYKTKQNMQQKLEHMTRAQSSLEMARQATVDLINNKKAIELLHNKDLQQTGDNLTTDLERHLYTEKVVLESELKATQEKVESFTNEKMRFIETMQLLNNNDVDNLKKELIERDQTIFQLEEQIKKDAVTIEQQKVAIDQANNEIDSLKQRIQLDHSTLPKDEEEVRKVLIDGKVKLEHAMKKTLENEQKIVKYESELAKQTALLVELENLLKVRDGLIGMMKQKKDDLMSENNSLTKYSNGVRAAIFEAHEALSEKTVEVQKLREALHDKSQCCQRLEKRVHELEVLITAANDKRFKLQDTIGCIEKELQSTKAHLQAAVTQSDQVNQTRYDAGTPSSNSTLPCPHVVRPIPIFRRSADQLYYNNQFGNLSHSQQPGSGRNVMFRHRPQAIQRVNNINSSYTVNRITPQSAMRKNRAMYNYAINQLKKNRAALTATEKEVQTQPTPAVVNPVINKDCSQSGQTSDESEESDSEIVHKVKTIITSSTHIRKIEKKSSRIYAPSMKTREHRRELFINALKKNAERFKQRIEQKQFIENVQKLSKYDQIESNNREYSNSTSLLFDGYNKYRVLKNGSLIWCKPTRDLHVSSMMMTKNLIAESCHKIKKDIESSLQLLETSCANIP